MFGVLDKDLSKRLQLKEIKLTLAESVKMVRQSEIIQDQLSIQNETAKSLEKVNKQKHLKQPQKKSFNRRQAGKKQRQCLRGVD